MALLLLILGVGLTLGIPAAIAGYRSPRLILDAPSRTGDERLDASSLSNISQLPSGTVPPISQSSNLSTGTGHLLTTGSGMVHSSTIGPLWKWFHIQVENIGLNQAQGCRGFLQDLFMLDAERKVTRPEDWTAPLSLRWANTPVGEVEKAIDSHSRHRLDLFRINLPAKNIVEFVGAAPNMGLPTIFDELCVWRALIVVASRNAKSVRAYFELNMGNGPDEIVIRKIPLDVYEIDRHAA